MTKAMLYTKKTKKKHFMVHKMVTSMKEIL